MEFRQLKQFVALAEELHFARAAERLGMEQSPLSHSIRNLEGELKTKLFHRTTRRTWLTRAGTRFYAEANRILADVEAATASLQASDSEPSMVRLALGEDLAGEPFTRLLFELEHHRPALSVYVRELTHADAIRLVRDGGADVALTFDARPIEGLKRRRAWGEPLMLIVPIGHPLVERDKITLSEIGSERLALPRTNTCAGYLTQVEEVFARHRVSITNRATVAHWNTAISFAAVGRALALCPASFVNGATGVAVLPIAEHDAEIVTWLLYSEVEDSASLALVLEIAALVDRDGVSPASEIP